MTSWRTLPPPAARTLACVPVLLFAAVLSAQRPASASASASPVSAWLVLGPLVARNAAFAGASDSAMLAASRLSLDHGWPAAGRSVPWLENDSATWTPRDAANGALQLAPPSTNALVYAATYLDADRFTRGKLTIDGVPAARRRVTLDGVAVGSDSITLRRGKHVVVVQLLQSAGEGVSLSMRLNASVPAARITASLDPRHPVTLDELTKTTEVRDIAVDPLGQRVAWVARRDDDANDRSLSVVEVHDLATGRMLAQLGGADASSPRWSRDGARLAYQTATDRTAATGRDLWIWSAQSGSSERVLRNERGLSGVEWGAKGDWLYYTSAVQLGGPETFKPGEAQRLTEVWDRWSFWPEKAQLNALSLTDGTRLKLVGDTMYSVEGARLSPDGRHLVFARSVRTTAARPWLRAELWVLDLGDVSTHKLLDLAARSVRRPDAACLVARWQCRRVLRQRRRNAHQAGLHVQRLRE